MLQKRKRTQDVHQKIKKKKLHKKTHRDSTQKIQKEQRKGGKQSGNKEIPRIGGESPLEGTHRIYPKHLMKEN